VRVDSGVAVAGRTLCNEELEEFAKSVVSFLGLPFVSNVQVRHDSMGSPALLEVNPRVPGSLALTRAAGVDMVRIAVNDLLGYRTPLSIAHREVAMVRPLQDLVVECEDLVAGAIPMMANL
jgi:carbamoyl-phosphate synthase large subunit